MLKKYFSIYLINQISMLLYNLKKAKVEKSFVSKFSKPLRIVQNSKFNVNNVAVSFLTSSIFLKSLNNTTSIDIFTIKNKYKNS